MVHQSCFVSVSAANFASRLIRPDICTIVVPVLHSLRPGLLPVMMHGHKPKTV
jgi:hypothetical protein